MKKPSKHSHREQAHDPPEAEHGMAQLDLIDTDGLNPRMTGRHWEESVDRMARSLKAKGQLEPVRLYVKPDGRYLVGFGHRRVAGAKKLGWEDIRAEVFPMPANLSEVYDARDRENLDHDTLNPFEELLLVKQAIKRNGGSVEAAATQLDRDPSWVRARDYIDRLDHVVCDLLAEERLHPAHARELAKLDKEAQRLIAREGARAKDGGGRLRSVEWFRDQVEKRRRSLTVVPWDQAKPYAGKRACAGCPANTGTDANLFEMGAGVCLNSVCYDIKAKAAGFAPDAAPVAPAAPRPTPLQKWCKTAAAKITAAAIDLPERWAALEALAAAWQVELPKKPETTDLQDGKAVTHA